MSLGFILTTFRPSDYTTEDSSPHAVPPYEWVSNMLPFGHPNLGGGRRQLLSTRSGKRRRNTGDHAVVRVLNVTESVYYATLNHTNPIVMNLLSQRLVQRCAMLKEGTFRCKPHFNTQKNTSKY